MQTENKQIFPLCIFISFVLDKKTEKTRYNNKEYNIAKSGFHIQFAESKIEIINILENSIIRVFSHAVETLVNISYNRKSSIKWKM